MRNDADLHGLQVFRIHHDLDRPFRVGLSGQRRRDLALDALDDFLEGTDVTVTGFGDQRGVTSALLALGRNLGLITGASAMGVLFAVGSGDAGGASETGLRLAFAASAAFVLLALGLSAWATRTGRGASD